MTRTLLLALAATLVPAAIAADKEVLVVYFSHSGHTRLLAEAIAEGARSVPATSVRLLTTGEATGPDLMAADAFIIGCPTYFGDQASNFSAWVETTWLPYWQHGNFTGKKGAAFTTGGGLAQVRKTEVGPTSAF
jgi:NAD(P)H dehydrogenase (quinone)